MSKRVTFHCYDSVAAATVASVDVSISDLLDHFPNLAQAIDELEKITHSFIK